MRWYARLSLDSDWWENKAILFLNDFSNLSVSLVLENALAVFTRYTRAQRGRRHPSLVFDLGGLWNNWGKMIWVRVATSDIHKCFTEDIIDISIDKLCLKELILIFRLTCADELLVLIIPDIFIQSFSIDFCKFNLTFLPVGLQCRIIFVSNLLWLSWCSK